MRLRFPTLPNGNFLVVFDGVTQEESGGFLNKKGKFRKVWTEWREAIGATGMLLIDVDVELEGDID